jgi:hypothetical protein
MAAARAAAEEVKEALKPVEVVPGTEDTSL